MEKYPAISVIVPVYNVERYVEASVRSVLAQTFGDFEVILIDDCSTDRSLDICKKLAQSDARIKLVRQNANRGPGPARNIGIKLAHGKYVYFVDSDDCIMPHALETLFRAAEQSGADVVHSTSFEKKTQLADNSFAADTRVQSDPAPAEGFITDDKNVRLQQIYTNFGMWIMLWLNLYRRDFLNRHSIRFPAVVGEDEPFFVSVLCSADKFFCIKDRFYVYNRRLQSETRTIGVGDSQRVENGISALLGNCRYISEALERTPSLTAAIKSACIQEYIERVTRNYILRRYDINGLNSADAMQNFMRALEPTFGEQSELAARLLQGLASRQLQTMLIKQSTSLPSISIVIPMYNTDRFIEQCLSSAVNQTFANFELIIVDDCSTDNSLAIAKTFADRDSRIKLIRQDRNLGQGAARNTGIDHARGKYVYFLDSDDLLLPNALEDLFRAAENSNADVVHSTSFLNMYERSDGTFDNVLEMQRDKTPMQGMLPDDRNARLLNFYANYNFWSLPVLNLCRRDFLDRNRLRFPTNMLSEDEPFAIALYCFAERYFCIPNHFYIYRRRKNTTMSTLNSDRAARAVASMLEGHRYISKLFARLPEEVLSTIVRNVCIQSFFSHMIENFILKFYTLENIAGAEAIQTFVGSLRPILGENADWTAHLFQAYVMQRMKATAARQELAALKQTK